MQNKKRRSGSMRRALSPRELLELEESLREAFRVMAALRKSHPMAEYIKFPSIPTLFSESLVICSTTRLFGPQWRAEFGGSVCDVVLQSDSGERRTVEVKATGAHEFQELKEKDLRADTLVWVRFGRRFLGLPDPVRVLVLDNPGRLISAPCRLDIRRLNRIVGMHSALRVIEVSDLSKLFS